MARPTKSIHVLKNRSVSKQEKEQRIIGENKLRGKNDKIFPGEHLTLRQQALFYHLKDMMEASGILGNMDIYILDQMAITIDRLREIETMINRDGEAMYQPGVNAARKGYMADFIRLSTELSLSPAARAKLANMTFKKQEEEQDPLLEVLKG